jgi:hypothetical protein
MLKSLVFSLSTAVRAIRVLAFNSSEVRGQSFPPDLNRWVARLGSSRRKLSRLPERGVSQIALSGGAILIALMDQINDLTHAVSHQTPPCADALIGGFDAYVKQNKSFASYVSYAIQTLRE